MKFSLPELASAVDGHLVQAATAPTSTVDGVSIDSRDLTPGALFVPLVAERDGHDFIDAAAATGAGAYLTSRPPRSDLDLPAIVVDDTARALTALGSLARSRLKGPVVGITGSVGKTSVKDLTLAACQAAGPAWASVASFNNELGVPLTLANAPEGRHLTDGVTIVEMGARGIGHIAQLCRIARPTVGLVTCVAMAHAEFFGSLDDVATGKGELVEALPADGVAVLNADDPRVLAMSTRTSASILTFGQRDPSDPSDRAAEDGADRHRPDVRLGPVRLDRSLRPTFTIDTDETGPVELTLAVRGAHMANNAAAALAAARAVGIPLDTAVDGLGRVELSPWRMEVAEAEAGFVVVNDAYNANPTSMRAALDALGRLEVDRRFAVVGVMAELGDDGPQAHRALAEEASEAGIAVIAVGAEAYGPTARHVADREEALAALGPLGPGDAVLVKGSRVVGLERLAATLLGQG